MAEKKLFSLQRWPELQLIIANKVEADKEGRESLSSVMEAAALDGLLSPSINAQRMLLLTYRGQLTPAECLERILQDLSVTGRPIWTARTAGNVALIEEARALLRSNAPVYERVTLGISEYDSAYLRRALRDAASYATETSLDAANTEAEERLKWAAHSIAYNGQGLDLGELLDTLREAWPCIYGSRAAYIVAMECCKLMDGKDASPEVLEGLRQAVVNAAFCWRVG